jgi:hypothetical protein
MRELQQGSGKRFAQRAAKEVKGNNLYERAASGNGGESGDKLRGVKLFL